MENKKDEGFASFIVFLILLFTLFSGFYLPFILLENKELKNKIQILENKINFKN